MINYARDHSTADGLDYISIWNASMLQPDEMAEAITANREQRAASRRFRRPAAQALIALSRSYAMVGTRWLCL